MKETFREYTYILRNFEWEILRLQTSSLSMYKIVKVQEK